jgi:hypothetical protein
MGLIMVGIVGSEARTDKVPVRGTKKREVSALDPSDAPCIASRLLCQYGKDAQLIAMDRADALFDLGNTKGARAWMTIAGVIEEQERACASTSDT